MDQITLYAFATFAIFLAGTIKGAVGLGLPTTSIGLMTIYVDPRTAIALVLIPMFVSNIWQLYRAGDVARAARQYAPFVICLVLFAALTVTMSRGVSERFLLAGLGILFLAFVAVNVTRWAPHLPERLDRSAQAIAGGISGIFGGLVGVWAPPMAIYLASRHVTKDEFVRASGLILCIGSLPLILGYIRNGFLTGELMVLATAMLIPTFAGFAIGERLRGHLSEDGFRRLLMVFFAAVGLNLLRRAIFG